MLNIQYLEEPEMCRLHEHKQVADGSTIHTPVFSLEKEAVWCRSKAGER